MYNCTDGSFGGRKTTLLRILMGLDEADSGSVEGIQGMRLSAVFQEDRLCGNLSPVSNIRLTAGSHFPKQTILRALEETDSISCASQPVRELLAAGRAGVWRCLGFAFSL